MDKPESFDGDQLLRSRLSSAASYCVPRWNVLLQFSRGEIFSRQDITSSVVEVVCCMLYVQGLLEMYGGELYVVYSDEYQGMFKACLMLSEHVCVDVCKNELFSWTTSGSYPKSFRVVDFQSLTRRRQVAIQQAKGFLGLDSEKKCVSNLFVGLSQKLVSVGQADGFEKIVRHRSSKACIMGYYDGEEVFIRLYAGPRTEAYARGSSATTVFVMESSEGYCLEDEVKEFCQSQSGLNGVGLM
jgi:hypothetical protein